MLARPINSNRSIKCVAKTKGVFLRGDAFGVPKQFYR